MVDVIGIDESADILSVFSAAAEFLDLRVTVLLTRAGAAAEDTPEAVLTLLFVAIVRYFSP